MDSHDSVDDRSRRERGSGSGLHLFSLDQPDEAKFLRGGRLPVRPGVCLSSLSQGLDLESRPAREPAALERLPA